MIKVNIIIRILHFLIFILLASIPFIGYYGIKYNQYLESSRHAEGVVLISEVAGTKVYRFYDEGYYRYFTVSTNGQSSMLNRPLERGRRNNHNE